MSSDSTGYRPDVDGLRAVAVLAVLLYHVGLGSFTGGYVGVDVFFVISGFLITRLIVSDLDRGRFTFRRFYLRRARRLFAALFFTLAVTFLAGSILLSAEHLSRLGLATVFAMFCTSNFFFWSEAGYFDTAAEFKPLLHCWSLSVEEQFYFVWPSALVLLARLRRSWIIPVFLVVAGLLSLFFAERWLTTDPDGAFFLAPFRIVEFALGALCVWAVRHQPKHGVVLDALTAIGLILVIYPCIGFSEATRFPGFNAMIPCLGTALLILAGPAPRLGILLKNRVAVGIGLISYSLYLAHWPILVFVKYRQVEPLDLTQKLLVVVVSLTVATLMYFYVETPFRYPRHGAAKQRTGLFVTACISLAVLVTLPATHAWYTDGWPWRLPTLVTDFEQAAEEAKHERQQQIRAGVCHAQTESEFRFENLDLDRCLLQVDDRPNILVYGNSASADLYLALAPEFTEVNFLQLTAQACLPSFDEARVRKQRCKSMVRFVLENKWRLEGIDAVFISTLWKVWDQESPFLDSTFEYFSSIDVPVVIFGPRPSFKKPIATLVKHHGRESGLHAFLRSQLENQEELKEILRSYTRERGGYFVDTDALWTGAGAKPFFEGERLLILDSGHWTVEGAAYFGKQLRWVVGDPTMLYSDGSWPAGMGSPG